MLKRILGAVVILGALALYISQVELKNDAVQAKIEKPFADLKPMGVKAVTVFSPGNEPFTLANSKAKAPSEEDGKTVIDSEISGWGIDGIVGADLDSPALNTLFSALQALTLKDGISAEEMGTDKTVYGLDPAAASLKITTANDAVRELTFGKVNEYVSQRYLQINNDPALYLVPSELFEVASKKQNEFRNRLPLIIYEGDVKELTLSDPQTSYVFQQGERWKMSAPKSVSVSSDVMNEVFRAIRSVRATEFVDNANTPENQASFGLAAPELTIKVLFKDEKKKPFEARFGRFKNTEGKAALAAQVVGSNHLVKFNEEVKARVMKSVNDYREKALASFDTYNVKLVLIKKGDTAINLTKNEKPSVPAGKDQPAPSLWLVNGKPADDPFVTGYFDTISKLEAKGFLDINAQGLGFDAPFGSVEITLDDGKVRKVILGNQLPESQRAIGVDKIEEPFTVDEAVAVKILPAQEVFIKAAPPVSDAQEGSSSSVSSAENQLQ